jgi:hypothetical protein
VVELPKIDPYLEEKEDYARIDVMWLVNTVDSINSALQTIQENLMSLDARITALGG